ncbi:MAG TPA: porin [Novimethylophilus sp.]|jgi:predicted porin|uniref:porin n=1 Tax=Novimethylophilus sp. TaxID=2137426 RepID=UPI002F3F1B85
MNKNLSKAVAVAVLAMGATAANAGIVIPAGDWTVDIGGNVNAYYQHDKFSGTAVGGSLASLGSGAGTKQNNINTGLLPSALGIGAKSRQGDFDVGFQFTFFTGVDSTGGLAGGGRNGALGNNSLNIRQSFLTFGDKSWGTIKMGRDLGVYEGDAILSDMTLLGVGSKAGPNGSSTVGRIGAGYLYADWKTQIQYASPNWNGFSFAAAVDTPWQATSLSAVSATGGDNRDMGFEGKASYEWAGDFAGKVWVGGISQKVHKLTATKSPTANGWDIGGKVGVAGFELVGSYYDGEGIGKTGFLTDGFSAAGAKRDSKGGYVQASYKLPVGTKLGVSWGESKLDRANAADRVAINASANGLVEKDRSWIIGAYHPLTKSVNLVAEYTDTKGKNLKVNAGDAKDKTFSLGAILFF